MTKEEIFKILENFPENEKAYSEKIQELEENFKNLTESCKKIFPKKSGLYYLGDLHYPASVIAALVKKEKDYYDVEFFSIAGSSTEKQKVVDLNEFIKCQGKFFYNKKTDLTKIICAKKEIENACTKLSRFKENVGDKIYCYLSAKINNIVDLMDDDEKSLFYRDKYNLISYRYPGGRKYYDFFASYEALFNEEIGSFSIKNPEKIKNFLNEFDDKISKKEEELLKNKYQQQETKFATKNELSELKTQINHKSGCFFWFCFFPLLIATLYLFSK